ncbi:hypothetical protein ACQY0O_007584 [Thecaphora frezii]
MSIVGANTDTPAYAGPAASAMAVSFLPSAPLSWQQHSFVDFDDSDSSEDDSSSLSSLESDDTIVSDDVLGETSQGKGHFDHQIPITFTGSAPGLERLVCPPKGGRSLPTSDALRPQNGCGYTAPCQDVGGAATGPSPLQRPVPVAPLRMLNLVPPSRRHSRSASLVMRHDAAFRSFQRKQEERCARLTAFEDDDGDQQILDILGFTSYARRGASIDRCSSPSVQRPELNRTLSQRNVLVSGITIITDDDSEEDDISSSRSDSPREPRGFNAVGQPRPTARSADERLRASAHLLRTLGSSQQLNRPGLQASNLGAGLHRRPPSLDQISSWMNAGLDVTRPQPRSISCPVLCVRPTQHNPVEVFVTPPTPRLADVDYNVSGVILRSDHNAITDSGATHLVVPAFDVAPGRTRMLEERQRAVAELVRLVQQNLVFDDKQNPFNVTIGQIAPPEANPVTASASFCGAVQLPRQSNSLDAGGQSGGCLAENGRQRAAPPCSTPERPPLGGALTDRSNQHESRYDREAPKYVAPGRRGYGQSGKGLPSNASRRHLVRVDARVASDGGRVAGPENRTCSSAYTSRAVASRTMMARLEQRRTCIDTPMTTSLSGIVR